MISYNPEKSADEKDALHQLYRVLKILRGPEGCPWDQKETIQTSVRNLRDESFELSDAAEASDAQCVLEETGDVMLNAVMLMIIASEDYGLRVTDILDSVSEKLIRRHPHVFSDVKAKTAEDALSVWNGMKGKEGKSPDENDFFSRIPKSKSVAERTEEVQKKVRKVGFDWDTPDGVYDKIREELSEVIEAEKNETRQNLKMELGDLLFVCMDLCGNLGFSAEECLHSSLSKFERRFNAVRKLANERGVEMKKGNLDALDKLWNEVKQNERV